MGPRWFGICIAALIVLVAAWLFGDRDARPTESVQEHVPLRMDEPNLVDRDHATRPQQGESRRVDVEDGVGTSPEPNQGASHRTETYAILRGTIVDERFEPLDVAHVTLRGRAPGNARDVRVSGGTFELANLEPGRCELTVRATDRRSFHQELELHVGQHPALHIVMPRAALVALTFSTLEGRPLRQAIPLSRLQESLWCAVIGEAAVLDSGAAELADLRGRPGLHMKWITGRLWESGEPDSWLQLERDPPCTLVLAWDDLVLERRAWTSQEGTWNVTLDPVRLAMARATLRFRLVDEAGRPVVRSSADLELDGRKRHPLDGQRGVFVANELAAGHGHLLLRARGMASRHAPVVLRAGEVSDLGDLVLHPTCAVTFELRGPKAFAGRAVELAFTPLRDGPSAVVSRERVSLHLADAHSVAALRLDALAPGLHRVVVSGVGMARSAGEVQLDANARLAWTIVPGVDVWIRAPQSKKVYHHVLLVDAAGRTLHDEALERGSLATCLEPGEYEVAFRAFGGGELRRRFHVVAGEPLEVTLDE